VQFKTSTTLTSNVYHYPGKQQSVVRVPVPSKEFLVACNELHKSYRVYLGDCHDTTKWDYFARFVQSKEGSVASQNISYYSAIDYYRGSVKHGISNKSF
jgi:hypothetical protein